MVAEGGVTLSSDPNATDNVAELELGTEFVELKRTGWQVQHPEGWCTIKYNNDKGLQTNLKRLYTTSKHPHGLLLSDENSTAPCNSCSIVLDAGHYACDRCQFRLCHRCTNRFFVPDRSANHKEDGSTAVQAACSNTGLQGAIHFVATGGHQRAWRNPHGDGTVTVTAAPGLTLTSSSHPISVIVGQTACDCVLQRQSSDEEAWVQIDLQTYSLQPNAYNIRNSLSFQSTAVQPLRSWTLEASQNGRLWVPLSQHKGDISLETPGEGHTWMLDGSEGFVEADGGPVLFAAAATEAKRRMYAEKVRQNLGELPGLSETLQKQEQDAKLAENTADDQVRPCITGWNAALMPHQKTEADIKAQGDAENRTEGPARVRIVLPSQKPVSIARWRTLLW